MAQHDRPGGGTDRSIRPVDARFAIVGANRSVLHAASWLIEAGAAVSGAESIKTAAKAEQTLFAVLVAGDAVDLNLADAIGVPVIVLWDFEVGHPGVGAFASAVSGVSSVIGAHDGAPGILPAHVPEQWTGIFGANLALGLILRRLDPTAGKARAHRCVRRRRPTVLCRTEFWQPRRGAIWLATATASQPLNMGGLSAGLLSLLGRAHSSAGTLPSGLGGHSECTR